eukprot:INCI15413.1.p1 GENE.INCI15413.1~~INCI15413.1.p1  ORF type:complete len:1629 (-),score=278.11 INCI15413.1:163-5049(-)
MAKERTSLSLKNNSDGGSLGVQVVPEGNGKFLTSSMFAESLGRFFLLNRAWFPTEEMVRAYHKDVQLSTTSAKHKRVFLGGWYAVIVLLAIIVGICSWTLACIQALDSNASHVPHLGRDIQGDHVHSMLLFDDRLSAFINVSTFEYTVDLESVKFLQVAFGVLVVGALVLGPLIACVLYAPTFQCIPESHWMEFLGTFVVLLFLQCSIVGVAVMTIFIEFVTDLALPPTSVWLSANLQSGDAGGSGGGGASGAGADEQTGTMSELDVEAVSVLENAVLFPLQISVILLMLFMVVMLMVSLAYVNMGFLRTLFFLCCQVVLNSVVVAVFLDVSSGDGRPPLSDFNVAVIVVLHTLILIPAVAAYYLYQRQRLMQFATTYHASLESIGLRRPQIVRELCRVDYNSKIGAGGTGQVYRGSYSGHAVAVKQFFSAALNRKKLDELNQEAELWAHVNGHPYIVEFFGIFKHDGNTLLVSELCDISLAKLVYWQDASSTGSLESDAQRRRPDSHVVLQPATALHIASQASKALAYLHAKGIAHLDVKPENILLKFHSSSGSSLQQAFDSLHRGSAQVTEQEMLNHLDPSSFVVKLCDFGMACMAAQVVDGDEDAEHQVVQTGTIRFLPPEQLVKLGSPEAPIPLADSVVEEELEDYVESLIRARAQKKLVPRRGETYLHARHKKNIRLSFEGKDSPDDGARWHLPSSLDLLNLARSHWSPDGTDSGGEVGPAARAALGSPVRRIVLTDGALPEGLLDDDNISAGVADEALAVQTVSESSSSSSSSSSSAHESGTSDSTAESGPSCGVGLSANPQDPAAPICHGCTADGVGHKSSAIQTSSNGNSGSDGPGGCDGHGDVNDGDTDKEDDCDSTGTDSFSSGGTREGSDGNFSLSPNSLTNSPSHGFRSSSADSLDVDVESFLGLHQSARETARLEGAARRAAAIHRRVKSTSEDLPDNHTLFGGALNALVGDDDLMAGQSPSRRAVSRLNKLRSNLPQHSMSKSFSFSIPRRNSGTTDLAAPGAGSKALAQYIVRNHASKRGSRHRKSLSQEIPVQFLVGSGVLASDQWGGSSPLSPLHELDEGEATPTTRRFTSEKPVIQASANTPTPPSPGSDLSKCPDSSGNTIVADTNSFNGQGDGAEFENTSPKLDNLPKSADFPESGEQWVKLPRTIRSEPALIVRSEGESTSKLLLHDSSPRAQLMKPQTPGLRQQLQFTKATTASSSNTALSQESTDVESWSHGGSSSTYSEESSGQHPPDQQKEQPQQALATTRLVEDKPQTTQRSQNIKVLSTKLFPDRTELRSSSKISLRRASAPTRKRSPTKSQRGFSPLGRLAAGSSRHRLKSNGRRSSGNGNDTSPTKKSKQTWRERMIALRFAVMKHLRENDPDSYQDSLSVVSDSDTSILSCNYGGSPYSPKGDQVSGAGGFGGGGNGSSGSLHQSGKQSSRAKRRNSVAIAELERKRMHQAWDVYSFGIVLWVLIRQQQPWHDVAEREVLFRVCRGERLSLDASDLRGVHVSATPHSPNTPAVSSAQLLGVQSPRTSAGMRWLLLSPLTKECWQQRPETRPTMHDVSDALDKMSRHLNLSVQTGVKPQSNVKGQWARSALRSMSSSDFFPSTAKSQQSLKVAPRSTPQ